MLELTIVLKFVINYNNNIIHFVFNKNLFILIEMWKINDSQEYRFLPTILNQFINDWFLYIVVLWEQNFVNLLIICTVQHPHSIKCVDSIKCALELVYL